MEKVEKEVLIKYIESIDGVVSEIVKNLNITNRRIKEMKKDILALRQDVDKLIENQGVGK